MKLLKDIFYIDMNATIDELKKFSEIFFVLMLGTGVGLSVERK